MRFVGGAAGGLVDDAFGATEGQGGGFVEGRYKLHGGTDHVRIFRDLVDDAEPVGFLGVEALAGCHHLHGAAEPDVADQALVAFPAGDDAEAHLRHADLRCRRHYAEIGRQQDFRAAADGEAIDRGDDWDVQGFEALEDRPRQAHDFAQLVLCAELGVAFYVAAGTEEPISGTRHNHRTKVHVALDRVENIEESLADFGTQRISRFGPVDGEDQGAAPPLLLNNFSQISWPPNRRRPVVRRDVSTVPRRNLMGVRNR